MRVVFLALDFKPRPGGVAEMTHRLAVELEHAGDDVTVLALSNPDAGSFDAGAPYRILRGVGGLEDGTRLARVRSIREVLDATAAEVLVANHVEPAGHHALLAALRSRVPLVVMAHGTEVNRRRGHGAGSTAPLAELRGRLWKGLALRGATRVTCSSAYTADLVRGWGVGPGRIRVVHPGADPVREDEATRRRVRWRARLGVGPDDPLVLFLGRLVRRKGADVLLEAFAEVRARVKGARLLVAGEGPLRAELEDRARAAYTEGAVHFLGAVPEEEKDGLLCAADVLTMPNRELDDGDVEGFGIVLLEAAARGVPSVAGRSGGVPEAVEHGRTGLLVDGSSPSRVSEALVSLLSDPERTRRLGRAARARVLAGGTWASAGRSFRRVCLDVSGSRLR